MLIPHKHRNVSTTAVDLQSSKDCMKATFFYPSRKIPRPAQTNVARHLLPILLIGFAILLVSSTAQAHGIGYYQIRGATVAPYFVHVWVAPGILRTGDIHVDTAVFDETGNPATSVMVSVAFVPMQGQAEPIRTLAGMPDPQYPHARGATLRLDTAGIYRMEVMVAHPNGLTGMTSDTVEVTTIPWAIKIAIVGLLLLTASFGLWLLYQTRAFWRSWTLHRKRHIRHATISGQHVWIRGETTLISNHNLPNTTMHLHSKPKALWMQRLNGPWHAPALWLYMLIIVAHWLEHVLQIYQIYGLGWEPAKSGGLLGVIYPQLIESETLHFVYDFIQWAGILLLRPGFSGLGRAATYWTIAMLAQTWHYIEHVLLMGQYLTGHYLFGAPQQISILQLWFPRAELHFTYNLLVFIPMVIAVHYYLQTKLATLQHISESKQLAP